MKQADNKALHRTAVPLRYTAASELGRSAELAMAAIGRKQPFKIVK